jgi:hypothetical protein
MDGTAWLRVKVGSYFTRGTLFIPLAWILAAIAIPLFTHGWSRVSHDAGLILASLAWLSIFGFGLHFFRRTEALIDRSVSNGLIDQSQAEAYRALLSGRDTNSCNTRPGRTNFSRVSNYSARILPAWIPVCVGVLLWAFLAILVASGFATYPAYEAPYVGGYTVAQHYSSLPYLLFAAVYGVTIIILWLCAVARIPISSYIVRDICHRWWQQFNLQDKSKFPRKLPAVTNPLDRRFKFEVREMSSVVFATHMAPADPFTLYFPILWTQTNGFTLGLGPGYIVALAVSLSLLILPGFIVMAGAVHNTIHGIREEVLDSITSELDQLQPKSDRDLASPEELRRIDDLTHAEESLDDLPNWFLNKKNFRDALILVAGAALGYLTTAISYGSPR